MKPLMSQMNRNLHETRLLESSPVDERTPSNKLSFGVGFFDYLDQDICFLEQKKFDTPGLQRQTSLSKSKSPD
jgi:hypothetical protein